MLQEGYFDKVYYRFFQTDKAIANIFAIHGLGGHSTWFDNAAGLFNKNKVNFFSFDLPGFGQSKYPKGETSSYKVWVDTTKEVLESFLVDFNVKEPVYILGHSMGALIAILLSKNVKPNGWILSVPGFEGYPETWPNSFLLPVLFKSIFNPKEQIALPFGPDLTTKNKDMQLKIMQDPFGMASVCAEIFRHLRWLSSLARKSSDSIKMPVFMLVAGEDKVCLNSAMEKFYEEIKFSDKCKKVYTSAFHDLFIEDELPQVVDDIVKWIKGVKEKKLVLTQ